LLLIRVITVKHRWFFVVSCKCFCYKQWKYESGFSIHLYNVGVVMVVGAEGDEWVEHEESGWSMRRSGWSMRRSGWSMRRVGRA